MVGKYSSRTTVFPEHTKLHNSFDSNPTNGMKSFTLDLREEAVDDMCIVPNKPWVQGTTYQVDYTWIFSKCGVYAFSKIREQKPAKQANIKIDTPMELVDCDLLGPFAPKAQQGYQYVFKTTDHGTRWTEVFLLYTKTSR